MTDIIQLLPDHVANQIAAGEVVQRPASVVKELLENAIDAKADTVTLVVKDAGKTLIQVIDNGIGMSVTDARLSFERHATSKIKAAEDLFNLHTKGFRGEALASIAAIAHVELKTKTEDSEIGTHLCIEGSEVISQDPAVVPQGTTLSVKNLFYNIPARRNFLKSDAVELRHIIDEFHRVALAHPQVALRLVNNGNDLFNLPISNQKQRIVHIFGRKMEEKLVPVSEETEIFRIEGFILKPEFAKKTRGEQFFFVNNRFIRSQYLHHAVLSAFDGLIKSDVHPGYFLFFEVDPKTIDINIHPTKTEVKFEEENAIYAMLRATIKHSLGQFNIAPVLDFDRDSELDTPYDYSKKVPRTPTIEVDRSFNPFKEDQHSGSLASSVGRHNFDKRPATSSWESLYIGLKDETTPSINVESVDFEQESETLSLFDKQQVEVEQTSIQIQNKYILAPLKSGLMVIHQHYAHQRILYEELLKNITIKEGVSQQLLFPIELQFSKLEVAILEKVREQLENIGFVFSEFSDESISIDGIPVLISESKVYDLLEQIISDIQMEVPEEGFGQNDRLAKSMARSMAVKTGVSLNNEERENIINQLFACTEPSVSPSNKRVFLVMNTEDLDKNFV